MALTGWEARPFVVGPASDIAAGTAATVFVMKAVRKLVLKKFGFAVSSDITANDTNYATIALTDGTTTFASASTTTGGTGNISANTLEDVSISVSEVAEDTNLYVNVSHAGTGAAVNGLVVQVEFEYIE